MSEYFENHVMFKNKWHMIFNTELHQISIVHFNSNNKRAQNMFALTTKHPSAQIMCKQNRS